jgi:hypothetical protein
MWVFADAAKTIWKSVKHNKTTSVRGDEPVAFERASLFGR